MATSRKEPPPFQQPTAAELVARHRGVQSTRRAPVPGFDPGGVVTANRIRESGKATVRVTGRWPGAPSGR
jgi:hypothetical protein